MESAADQSVGKPQSEQRCALCSMYNYNLKVHPGHVGYNK